MVEQLIDFLNTYKIEMEFKGLDFDADKCTQCKYLRISLARLYSCTDPKHPNFLCFGHVSVTDVPENFDFQRRIIGKITQKQWCQDGGAEVAK
jgi:hypothetical protein